MLPSLSPYSHSPDAVPQDAAFGVAGSKDATSVYGPLFTTTARGRPRDTRADRAILEATLELIAELARDFTVLSEVGSKDSSVEYTPKEWTTWLREERDAGAWKVITEAREGGTAGIFAGDGAMRTEVVSRVADAVGLDEIVFEAPTKASQAWFVKQFGPTVNLGNIPPDEVIPLETLRLGLRGDTLKEVLLAEQRAPAS